MDTRVYPDPREPGAPQPGDVVVVVKDFDPDGPQSWIQRQRKHLDRQVRLLSCVAGEPSRYSWWVTLGDPNKGQWVHSVRRPTEVELVAWALIHPGGAP